MWEKRGDEIGEKNRTMRTAAAKRHTRCRISGRHHNSSLSEDKQRQRGSKQETCRGQRANAGQESGGGYKRKNRRAKAEGQEESQ